MIRNTGSAAVVVVVLGCAARQHSDAPVVRSLRVEGNDRLSSGAIKKKILTTETSALPFASKRYFDPTVWEADQRRVERLYEASGDYHARVVKAEVLPRTGRNEVDLVLHVAEDHPVLIERVHIDGLDALPAKEREKALDDLPLEPGEPFREADWQAAKSSIRDKLRAQGYAEAQVDGQANVDIGKYQASLELVARPGAKYRFGDIVVRGQPGGRIDPLLVREQVALALHDEVFSDELVDEAQRRVFGMGVFSTARVRLGTPDRTTARIPIIVEVREGPFRSLKLGGGVAVDQIRNEIRAIGEWSNRDFLGGMRKLTATLTAGWAFIPDLYSVLNGNDEEGARNGPIYQAKLEFEQPRLFRRPSLKEKSLLASERTLEETYNAIGGRTRHGVSWEPYSSLTISPNYELQAYWLNGPNSASALTAPLALGCKTDPCFIVVSFLEQVVTWDKRDSPLEPKKGHYLTMSLQEGGGPLGGDFDYFRIVPEARGYVTLGDDRWLTLAARLQVGTLLTVSGNPDDSAVVTRFTAGGAMSMRGYSLRRLSPLLLTQGPASPSGAAPILTLPIGGNGIIEGSFEARTNLTEHLALAAFIDFGTVTRDSLNPEAIATVNWALGMGLRYLTAVGPIRVDIGYRLPFGRPPPLFDDQGREITYRRIGDTGTQLGSETGDNVNKTCFGIGGSNPNTWVRDGLCVFHISIGEAF